MGSIVRNDGGTFTISYSTDIQLGISFSTTGTAWIWCSSSSASSWANRPFVAWIEYTKS